MNEKLVLAASAVVNVLALCGVWLTAPEKFLLVLTGYTAILVFGLILALAGSQEEKIKRHASHEEGRRPCT